MQFEEVISVKKRIAAVICGMLALLLVGCGSGRGDPTSVIGKTFVYEKDGFFGDFKIDVRADGTFTYYEGAASSYIGMGEWTIGQNTITLRDGKFTNVFEIGKGTLIWRADGSDNFAYVKVQDGEAFREE